MPAAREEIIKVEVLDTGELQLVLGSGGDPSYQFIYREARGVYWNHNAGAFRGTERQKWSIAKWYGHIVDVCADIGITLVLSGTVEWVAVPASDRKEILDQQNA